MDPPGAGASLPWASASSRGTGWLTGIGRLAPDASFRFVAAELDRVGAVPEPDRQAAIDALESMGTDPIKKLVTPRLLALLIMLPPLTLVLGRLLIGAALLIDADGMRQMATDFLANRALIFCSGFLTVLAGLAIVITHNVWAVTKEILILGPPLALVSAFRWRARRRLSARGRSRQARNDSLPARGTAL